MKLGVFRCYGANNSPPVFDAFCQGAARLGWQCETNSLTADVAVIWSMLWRGKMSGNREVWNQYRTTGRPVIVLEVGMLQRGRTWKMGLGGVNGTAHWCPVLDPQRANRLGITLRPWRQQGDHVLIALQRSDSEQWHHMPNSDAWLRDTVDQLRSVTDRPLRVRCHPRQRWPVPSGVQVSAPRSIPGTYDAFDLERDLHGAWAVINASSAPGCQAVIQGIPAFVDNSSLARPVANLDLRDIESPLMPDRETWLTAVSHTEWLLEEFITGDPQLRLMQSH